jgi:hypothetical protein
LIYCYFEDEIERGGGKLGQLKFSAPIQGPNFVGENDERKSKRYTKPKRDSDARTGKIFIGIFGRNVERTF